MLTHCGTKEIETSRLYLRQFKYSDGDDMLKHWISDPKVQSMLSEPIYSTKEEVRGLLEQYIAAYQNDDYYRWGIVEKESLACIGQIAIFLVNEKNHWCEIEYCIGSQFHRKGFASEAAKAIIDFAFEQVNFHKMQVCHKENNMASKGVILKCGFICEGTLRDYFYMDGNYVSRCFYSMLKPEWENARTN
jgi:ribosomal-protein-alanine N-acetyltransferase